jgi:hypothetical protein
VVIFWAAKMTSYRGFIAACSAYAGFFAFPISLFAVHLF